MNSELLIGVLTKFKQSTAGSLGVEESDVEAFGATARSLVNHATALVLDLLEGVGHTILDSKRNVLDAAAAAVLLDKLGDGALGACGLEQLNLCLAHLEESGADMLVLNLLDGETLEAKHLLVERNGLVKTGDGNADMLNVRNLHNSNCF